MAQHPNPGGPDQDLGKRELDDRGSLGRREQPSFGPEDDPAFHEHSYHGQNYGGQGGAGPQTYGAPDFGGYGSDYIGQSDGADGQHRGRGPKGYRRSDARIFEEVSEHLTIDPYLDASDIEVTVIDCEVTLSGTVATRDDRRRAEQLLDKITAITHIQNNLRVG